MNNLHEYKGAGWSEYWPTLQGFKGEKVGDASCEDAITDNLAIKPK